MSTHKFKVGDKVRVIASPNTLPDHDNVGTFTLRSDYLNQVYISW